MHTKISRRESIKASGVVIALPFLESMNSAVGRELVTPPKRLVFICSTLGFHSPSLFPDTRGSDYKNTEYLELLNDHRDNFTLFSGLSHPDQNGKQPHDTEMTWLSAARNPGLGGFRNSISVDQFATSQLGRHTRFPSVVLSSDGPKSQSYTSNGVMLPAEHNPSTVFAKLFLTGSPVEVRRQRQQLAEGRSILDLVGAQARALNRKTSGNDRRQLEEYFEAIREAEVELEDAEAWLDRPKPRIDEKPPLNIVDKADLIGRTQSLFKLIPLILQSDSSRIVTMVIQDHLVVPKITGVSGEHHNLSHHGKDPAKIKQLKIIEKSILKCFADFLSQMARPTESDQRLLDHTSILFGSNLGNANAHDPTNLPIILAGGGHTHGRHVANDRMYNIPLCNLFVSLLNNNGVETDQFSTSTGSIEI